MDTCIAACSMKESIQVSLQLYFNLDTFGTTHFFTMFVPIREVVLLYFTAVFVMGL